MEKHYHSGKACHVPPNCFALSWLTITSWSFDCLLGGGTPVASHRKSKRGLVKTIKFESLDVFLDLGYPKQPCFPFFGATRNSGSSFRSQNFGNSMASKKMALQVVLLREIDLRTYPSKCRRLVPPGPRKCCLKKAGMIDPEAGVMRKAAMPPDYNERTVWFCPASLLKTCEWCPSQPAGRTSFHLDLGEDRCLGGLGRESLGCEAAKQLGTAKWCVKNPRDVMIFTLNGAR